jgi:hypothetical protein
MNNGYSAAGLGAVRHALRALSSLSFERLRSFGVSLSWGPPTEEFGSWLSGRVGHFGLTRGRHTVPLLSSSVPNGRRRPTPLRPRLRHRSANERRDKRGECLRRRTPPLPLRKLLGVFPGRRGGTASGAPRAGGIAGGRPHGRPRGGGHGQRCRSTPWPQPRQCERGAEAANDPGGSRGCHGGLASSGMRELEREEDSAEEEKPLRTLWFPYLEAR